MRFTVFAFALLLMAATEIAASAQVSPPAGAADVSPGDSTQAASEPATEMEPIGGPEHLFPDGYVE